MKKQLLTLTYLFFFSILGLSQGLEWSFNLKSNYSIMAQSVSNFDANRFLNTSANHSYDNFDKSNAGFGIGIQTNFKIYKGFSFISGIEGVLWNYNDGILDNLNVVASNDLEDYSLQRNLELERLDQGNNFPLVQMETDAGYLDPNWNQNITYIKIPINFGYSFHNKNNGDRKAMLFGGLWYARLFQSDYQGTSFLFSGNRLLKKNILGANAGIELNLAKKVSAIVDVAQNLTGSYSSKYSYLTTGSRFGTLNGVPTGKNAKTVSLGLNFLLK